MFINYPYNILLMATLITDKAAALAELRRIIDKTSQFKKFGGIAGMIEKIFDPKTFSHEIRIKPVSGTIFDIDLGKLNDAGERDTHTAIKEFVFRELNRLGYRENILTHQEHRLIGSTVPEEYKIKCDKEPYVPIGILVDGMTIEEATKARKLEVFCEINFPSMYGIGLPEDTEKTDMTLEPLDAKGRTVRDPRHINMIKLDDALRNGMPLEQAFDVCVTPFIRNPEFPFRRN